MNENEIKELKEYIAKGKRWKVMGIRMIHSSSIIREHLSDQEWMRYQELIESARESL